MTKPLLPGTPDAVITADGMQALKEFFSRMSACCAAVDFDSAEVLFAPDVVSFGTKATIVSGLDNLRSQQWEHIWPNIEGFEMLLEQMHGTYNDNVAWGMLPWTSKGFDTDGNSYARPGRATAVLERREGKWLCIHTHFSLAPETGVTRSGKLSGN